MRFGWIFGLLLSATWAVSSFACEGSNVIVDESFQKPESGWGAASDHVSYGPLGMALKWDLGQAYTVINDHYTSDGTDLCVTAIWPSDLNPGDKEWTIDAGIIFWAKDNENFYAAFVDNLGYYAITRYVGDHPRTIAKAPAQFEFVNKRSGDKNELEVQISGAKGTFLINGKKVLDFGGQPPTGTGSVGVWAESAAPREPRSRGNEYTGIFATNTKGNESGAPAALTFQNFRIASYR